MIDDQLSVVFGALADPTRRAILTRLTQGDATVAALAAPFRVSQPAISRHLKVLEQAGLISRRRRATARLSHLEAEPLREATAWLARYQEYWDESYDRLDALLAALQDESSASLTANETVQQKGTHHGQGTDRRRTGDATNRDHQGV
jgi:DNA-binding transcriptional ArsR family regulator